MNNISAILFDMNGVIIDDEHIHEHAFKKTVATFGIDLDHQSYLDCCAGKTDRAGYQSIAEKYQKSLPIDSLLIDKEKQYLELFPTEKKSYPGIIECIHRLYKNYDLALTSSSNRVEVELITGEFEIKQLFKVMVTGNDVNKGKPDPEPYLKTCNLLGINPRRAVVIEDSASGVTSAITAGCKCIGITTTHSREQLLVNRPTDIINSFEAITSDYLEKL